MASWKQWTLTQKGQQFQAKVNAGLVDEVTYTKFALGSGIASGSLESLTELVKKELDLPMKSVASQNNAVEFNTLILNNDVEADFYCREMGLYVTDPDDGEILYAVSTDNYPDLMPAAGSATVIAYDFTLILIFSNTGEIVSYVNMKSLATMQDIENHNTNADAHANLALLINDALAPTKDNDTLKNLLSGLAYMITKITGKDDWKAAPVISIAAILSSLSDNVAVNWDSNKFTVPALGVSGLMAQNGYINFGKLFGGLIVQWGKIEGIPKGSWTTYPIYMTNTYAIVMTDINIANDPLVLSATPGPNHDGFNSFGRRVIEDDGKIYGTWVAIGK